MKTSEVLENANWNYKIDRPVLGIDIGSRQSKAVLLVNDDIFTAIVPTGYVINETAENLLQEIYEQSGYSRKDIAYVIITGYGRVSLKFDDIPGRVLTEIACHGMGAHFLAPGIKTVIDIGGQDSKAIKVDPETGRVVDFAMNDKCAAGTGRFLERMAKVLGVDVMEIGELSLKADKDLDVSAQCIVFAESEVVSERAKGTSVENISAGLHRSVARRVHSLLKRVGIEKNVLFTGGVSNNIGIRKAFEELLGFEISKSTLNTVYAGALGAAVFAGEYLAKGIISEITEKQADIVDLSSLENAISEQRELMIKHETGKKKNVAYICAYVPVEVLGAADVSAFRIMEAGDQDTIMAGEVLVQSVFCDLTKSVLGGFAVKDPLYRSVDQVFSFFTCDCMRKAIEAINNLYVPATVYNLPRAKHSEDSKKYYLTELEHFKSDLEQLTGEKIDDNEINIRIAKYNQAKELLRKISGVRKRNNPPLSGSQFQDIAKSYYYLPVDRLIDELVKIDNSLEDLPEEPESTRPRIMLSGGILADGDRKLTRIIEDFGIDVVVEDNCSGLKPFLNSTPETGNWMEDIADAYLNQAPCARMKPIEEMIEVSVNLAKEYRVDGVIFYYLKFCPCYSIIISKYQEAFQKINIPVLVVTSDYSVGDEGQIKIRVESFAEILEGGLEDAG